MPKSSKRQLAPARPRKPEKKESARTVSIIGAGRMGTALALALKAAGCQIEIVVAKHSSHARRAAKAIGGEVLGLSAEQLNHLEPPDLKRFADSSLVLIATPDDAIPAVAGQVAAIIKSSRLRKVSSGSHIALHTSGALSARALRPLRSAGFAVGSMHPLVSISESRSGARALGQAFFSLEGDLAAVRGAKSLVRQLGAQSFVIQSRHKSLYHAAAVMASPHVVALFDMAQEMLGRCGVSPRRVRQVLLPLMKSTIENLSRQSPEVALTGTFKRGDTATARNHIDALLAEKLIDTLQTYILLGRRSLELARRVAPDSSQLEQIALLLSPKPGKPRR
jgi:predicted short-subunit dehydrogenase-like oxidoreductase (DUF2520 family)